MKIEKQIHFAKGARARKVLREGSRKVIPPGRVPRISRLMALAIHMQELLDSGEASTYSNLASLGHVSRARISQVMKLNYLAPEIQEELLFLPRIEQGSEEISERRSRTVAAQVHWKEQRGLWEKMRLHLFS